MVVNIISIIVRFHTAIRGLRRPHVFSPKQTHTNSLISSTKQFNDARCLLNMAISTTSPTPKFVNISLLVIYEKKRDLGDLSPKVRRQNILQ